MAGLEVTVHFTDNFNAYDCFYMFLNDDYSCDTDLVLSNTQGAHTSVMINGATNRIIKGATCDNLPCDSLNSTENFICEHDISISNVSEHTMTPNLTNLFDDYVYTDNVALANETTDTNDSIPNQTHNSNEIPDDPYIQLSKFSKDNSRKIIFSHLNVNSLSRKFMEIHEILQLNLTDMFFLSETKLDNSFPNAQFNASPFIIHRLDRNAHGGGLLVYVRETSPHKFRSDIAINMNGIESIVIQVKTNKINMMFLHLYKPPNIPANTLTQATETMLNKCMQETKSVIIIGDLNVNFLNSPNQLTELCDTFDLKQVVRNPTCFKSLKNPSLLDVIVTNCPKSLSKTVNLTLGISDFHNYISTATRINCPTNEPKTIYYRSFKNFDTDTYNKDLH